MYVFCACIIPLIIILANPSPHHSFTSPSLLAYLLQVTKAFSPPKPNLFSALPVASSKSARPKNPKTPNSKKQHKNYKRIDGVPRDIGNIDVVNRKSFICHSLCG